MGSSLTIGIRAGGQQMEQMRESSTRCKLWGLGSVGGKWVRNLLCSSSHLLRFPLQEEKKKKHFPNGSHQWMEAEFYVGYKMTLLLTFHLRITIRFFLHNVKSLPNKKVSSFIKITLLLSGIFQSMNLAASFVSQRSPSLTSINHFPVQTFLFLCVSSQLELAAVRKAQAQKPVKKGLYN